MPPKKDNSEKKTSKWSSGLFSSGKTVTVLNQTAVANEALKLLGAKDGLIGWSGTLRLLVNIADFNGHGGILALVRRSGRSVDGLGESTLDHIVAEIQIDVEGSIQTALNNYKDAQLQLSMIRLIRKSLNALVPVMVLSEESRDLPVGDPNIRYVEQMTPWSSTLSGSKVRNSLINVVTNMTTQSEMAYFSFKVGSINTIDIANKTPKLLKVLINVATTRCILSCLLHYNKDRGDKYLMRDKHRVTVARATEFLEEFYDISSLLKIQNQTNGQALTPETDGLKLKDEDWNVIYRPSLATSVNVEKQHAIMHAYSGFVERVYFNKNGEQDNADENNVPVKSLTDMRKSVKEMIAAYERQVEAASLPNYVTSRVQVGSSRTVINTIDTCKARLIIFQNFMKNQVGLKSEEDLFNEDFELLDPVRLSKYKFACTMNAVTGQASKQFSGNLAPDESVPVVVTIKEEITPGKEIIQEGDELGFGDIPKSKLYSLTEDVNKFDPANATRIPAVPGQVARDQMLN